MISLNIPENQNPLEIEWESIATDIRCHSNCKASIGLTNIQNFQ